MFSKGCYRLFLYTTIILASGIRADIMPIMGPPSARSSAGATSTASGTLMTPPPRTLHGGTQWISLSGTTEVRENMTVSNIMPVWTANETNFLTVLSPTATSAPWSTVYFSFITGTVQGEPTDTPSIKAVVIAPALIPVLQRVISSGGGNKTNDTIDDQLVGALAARGYEASDPSAAELIPVLGSLLIFLRLYFGSDPDAGLKVSPYVDMNERIPGAGSQVTTSSEEPIFTAIPEPAYPNWQFLRIFFPPMGPLPTDYDFGSPYTSTSTSSTIPTASCVPGSVSANTSEAITHAKGFCSGSSIKSNDTCEFVQWAGNNQYLALGFEASNGTCIADCPTTFSDMIWNCQNNGRISGSGVIVDGCGTYAFNITDVPPIIQFPIFSVTERSHVPLPPPSRPASLDICVVRGNIFPAFPSTCSLTILGTVYSPREFTFLEADIFDLNCYQRGSILDPTTPLNITSQLQDPLLLKELGFGQNGATAKWCYGGACWDSTSERECQYRPNPYQNPRQNAFSNTFALNCPFPC